MKLHSSMFARLRNNIFVGVNVRKYLWPNSLSLEKLHTQHFLNKKKTRKISVNFYSNPIWNATDVFLNKELSFLAKLMSSSSILDWQKDLSVEKQPRQKKWARYAIVHAVRSDKGNISTKKATKKLTFISVYITYEDIQDSHKIHENVYIWENLNKCV